MLGVFIRLDPEIWNAEQWDVVSDVVDTRTLEAVAFQLNQAAEHAINSANRLLMDESIEQIKAHEHALDEFLPAMTQALPPDADKTLVEEVFIALMEDFIHTRDTELDSRLGHLQ